MDQKQMLSEPPSFYEADIVTESVHIVEKDSKKKHINEYEIKELLGQGSFGKVKRVTRRYVEEGIEEPQFADYAMKIYNRSILENQRTAFYENDGKQPRMTNMMEFAENEINVWKYLDHPNVCKLYQIIDDPQDAKCCIYCITQLGDLGSLMSFDESENVFRRNPKVIKYFSEQYQIEETNIDRIAAKIFKQVAQGVKYLHEEKIAWRDLKVDNVVVTTKYGVEESVKIIDFSTARQLNKIDQRSYDCAGTIGFRAPEQQFSLEDGYLALKSDIWAFGVSLFCYLNETLPFWGDGELMVDLNARKLPLPFTEGNTQAFRQLLEKCCSKDPEARPTIDEIIMDPWF